MLQEFVEHFTYSGIFALLLVGSLGVPIPEEVPIIAAAVLSQEAVVRWWVALPLCVVGVLAGDVVLYWVGRHWGEHVLNWRVVRLFLTRGREEWLKAAYREHALKTIVTARHITGLRAAAFLIAGIARVPFWKFLVADAGAAVLGVSFWFALAYTFADQLGAIVADVHRVERWLMLGSLTLLAAAVGVSIWRWNRRIANAPMAEQEDAMALASEPGETKCPTCLSALALVEVTNEEGQTVKHLECLECGHRLKKPSGASSSPSEW
jgi:membrane protein DedA with SNARE-associated domain